MNFINALQTSTSAADTVFHFATHNWNKKTLTRAAITAVILLGGALIIQALDVEGY